MVLRLLVCGSRVWTEKEFLESKLDQALEAHGQLFIIHGAANGADTHAGDWATKRGQEQWAFPADWARHGRRAGPIRNQRMLDEAHPDMTYAFTLDLASSKGTKDMVSRSKKTGLFVRVFGVDEVVAESVAPRLFELRDDLER